MNKNVMVLTLLTVVAGVAVNGYAAEEKMTPALEQGSSLMTEESFESMLSETNRQLFAQFTPEQREAALNAAGFGMTKAEGIVLSTPDEAVEKMKEVIR